MGGGDLNSKKSWHPNTMKNQERVWKAEQAAAEEKKRIMELQQERTVERDRAELNALAKRSAGTSVSDNDRLHWMYDKPDKKAQDEDYLLGKTIEKNFQQSEKPDEVIPAVARRVIGSSMMTTAEDTQVDLARKVREDPLLLVKERERAARAALLNNPIHRKRLAELLRKEQECQKEGKDRNKSKKKDHDLDDKLAAKLNALGGEKQINLAALLASDDSTSSSDSEKRVRKKKKKEKKKSKKSKKSKRDSDAKLSESDRAGKHKVDKLESASKLKMGNSKSHKRRGSSSDDESKSYRQSRQRTEGFERYREYSNKKAPRGSSKDRDRHQRESSGDRSRSRRRDDASSSRYDRHRGSEDKGGETKYRRNVMSQEEKAQRLAAMAAAGAEREVQRGQRVQEQRDADTYEANSLTAVGGTTARSRSHVLPQSLEARIHSNRHYIQRDRTHMNEHFARR